MHTDLAPAPRTRTTLTLLGSLLVAVILGIAIGVGILWFLSPMVGRQFAPLNDVQAEPREVAPKTPLDRDEQEAVNLFKNVKSSVVNVDTVVFVRRLDMRVEQQAAGTGSGFFWDDEGRIVTNFHVIQEAILNRLTLRVVDSERQAHEARVVGVAPEYDLAVLKIDIPADRSKKIKVGTSSDLEVGQKVYAIGNPYGLSLSMTSGIVSALEREIESPSSQIIAGAIQTDAPINPGNSGGPLLDKDGRLVGVNTAIRSPSGGNVGIGFAIPVDTVNTIVPELIRNGKILKPDLGLRLVDERRLRRAGFADGVMILEVSTNGPAARAGLQGLKIDPRTGDVEPGDVILAINGQEVLGNIDFQRKLGQLKIGSTAKLRIDRSGEELEIEVEVRGV